MADQTVPPRRSHDGGGRWDDADPTAAYRALRDGGEPVLSDVAARPSRGRHAQHDDDHPEPVGGYAAPRRSHRGPQWVAPDGSAHTTKHIFYFAPDIGEVKQEIYRDNLKVSEIVLSDYSAREPAPGR